MTGFLRAIPANLMDAGASAWSTMSLAAEKFAESAFSQRVSAIAQPILKPMVSNYPQRLKFNAFSRDFVAGTAVVALALTALGMIANYRDKKKRP